jgi:hypothetical protein
MAMNSRFIYALPGLLFLMITTTNTLQAYGALSSPHRPDGCISKRLKVFYWDTIPLQA